MFEDPIQYIHTVQQTASTHTCHTQLAKQILSTSRK